MSIEFHVTKILADLKLDPTEDNLKDTPKRVSKMLVEMTSGYGIVEEELYTLFDADGYNEMILLKDIEFASLCEHHMLPFLGVAHVAYIPEEKIVGISKLARIVDMYSKRLQVQERITTQVTASLMRNLVPVGAACVIEAKHMCMQCRGIKKQNSLMVTSSLAGAFKDDPTVRAEFLNHLNRS